MLRGHLRHGHAVGGHNDGVGEVGGALERGEDGGLETDALALHAKHLAAEELPQVRRRPSSEEIMSW